ncbi:MAG: L,D-transpeptidase [Myxococcales bacterium]|nr:MAG: L,D-transpeptidase [Myxococcales bacterium]
MNVQAPRTTSRIALALAFLALACEKEPPPGATDAQERAEAPRAGSPVLPPELSPRAPTSAAAPPAEAPGVPAAPEGPWTGPWFAVTSPAAGIYSEMSFERSKKTGFIRSGGRTPVEPGKVEKKNCTGGWYKVHSGGYVCGNYGTTDLNHPDVRFATSQPNLKEILPYPYARNAKNGTPLYKTVPSREQMEKYEPYLKEKPKEEAPEKDAMAKAAADAVARSAAAAAAAAVTPDSALPIAAQEGATQLVPSPVTQDPEPDKPWWQQEDIKDRLHQMKLDSLSADSDDILAKRMVSGFYVAVDKTFRWNGRSWYKTTKGLVAPSDRMWQASGSSFKGVELDGTTYKLPLGWVYGGNKSAGTYNIDVDAKTIKNAKTVERFVALPLTGKYVELQGKEYAELTDGTYIKKSQIRITEPGPPPQGLAEGERYVDVDLSSQTLVAFEGGRAVYATLISSGKHSKNKEKDHSTPTGEWRIREKHITTTMDGDGTAAGDLPYSIEDVPFVQYYHRSFALHAAFWHSNFGVQMSHGCVNLAPLDAKWLFFFTGPHLPEGFHGVWSNESAAGSRVIVHD